MSGPGYNLPMQDTAELFGTDQLSYDIGDFSTTRLHQDVNESLLPDVSSMEMSGYEAESNDLWRTAFTPFANASVMLPFDDSIRPIRRVDSGLNAKARPFVPASLQSCSTNTNSIPRSQRLQQQLTPIRTDFSDSYHNQCFSAPAYQHGTFDTSPLLTVTDAMQMTQPATGIQWPYQVQPAQSIGAWVGSSTYSADTQLNPNYNIDPAYLTPTTPGSYCGSMSGRSRSQSIASAASYTCEHNGCNKNFKSKTDFAHHRRNHGEKKHPCHRCPKRFVFRKDLNRHAKTHNPDERHYFCPVSDCQWLERGFQRKDHFDRHMRTHASRSTGILTPVSNTTPMSRSASGR